MTNPIWTDGYLNLYWDGANVQLAYKTVSYTSYVTPSQVMRVRGGGSNNANYTKAASGYREYNHTGGPHYFNHLGALDTTLNMKNGTGRAYGGFAHYTIISDPFNNSTFPYAYDIKFYMGDSYSNGKLVINRFREN